MKNILIIDDNEAILSALVQGLEILLKGCNILSAKNGKEALRILNSVPVDLMVTDLNMPEMDGCELLTYMRENKPGIKVFAMTADYNPEVQRRLRSLGVSKCFEKPFRFRDLAAWILGMLKLSSPHPLSMADS